MCYQTEVTRILNLVWMETSSKYKLACTVYDFMLIYAYLFLGSLAYCYVASVLQICLYLHYTTGILL